MPAKLVTPLVPGAVIGPYRIANVPGDGAVGEAVDSTLRRVAIKRLPEGLVDNWEKLAEFRALIQSISELHHPGIVGVHGVEVHDGTAYLVMDFAVRGSLANQVASLGRLPWLEATRRLIDASRTIEAVHGAGIVHGAIRPSNLLLSADGGLLLADFGGAIVGPRTGDYSAPELFSGSPPNPAADVYSLGATYFALLTGQAPFADATDEVALADAHAIRPVPNVRAGAAEMPLRCEMIVRRAMAKSPQERYPSAAALRADLEAVLQADQTTTAQAPSTPNLKPVWPPPRRSAWPERLRRLLPLIIVTALCAGVYLALPLIKRTKTLTKDKPENPTVEKRPALVNSLGMRFIQAPSGAFIMGEELLADARPHPVRFVQPFLIGTTEVTQREFQAVIGSNPSHFRGDKNPVDSVTWEEAREFCERLSSNEAEKRAGRSYRLPTEAEWEYACRAGSRAHFAFGSQLRLDQANIRSGGTLRTTPSGTYPPNAWGLFDMHGNVWEWCSDWYKSDYYATSPIEEPTGPPTGIKRVVRGGSWLVGPDDCLSARRGDSYLPTQRSPDVGFRVVCIAPDFEPDER